MPLISPFCQGKSRIWRRPCFCLFSVFLLGLRCASSSPKKSRLAAIPSPSDFPSRTRWTSPPSRFLDRPAKLAPCRHSLPSLSTLVFSLSSQLSQPWTLGHHVFVFLFLHIRAITRSASRSFCRLSLRIFILCFFYGRPVDWFCCTFAALS